MLAQLLYQIQMLDFLPDVKIVMEIGESIGVECNTVERTGNLGFCCIHLLVRIAKLTKELQVVMKDCRECSRI